MAGLICLLMVQIVYAGAESTGAEAEGLVWPEVSTQAFQSGQSAAHGRQFFQFIFVCRDFFAQHKLLLVNNQLSK